MPTAKIESVKPSEMKGVYEAVIEGNVYYVSEDGKYLLQGHLIDIKAKKDLTEEKLAAAHKQDLEAMGENNMIIFKAKIKKYQISVFTDIDCGYCRKLHSEMDQYLAEGITVRYLFFPRAGKGSESYNKAISVWCADDRNAALTAAKQGKNPESKQCKNPVDAHMALAEKFGVKGTPMIVTEKGNVLPGYVPAKQLAQALASGE
jgi:thiol:disulfide interchange protein DsbC